MPKVLIESFNETCVITINRPERKNAIDAETADGLVSAFNVFEEESSLSVAILTGAGGDFCSGADLKAIAGQTELAPRVTPAGNAPLGISRMTLTKPVIAAVEGYAVAGGLELALWCDLRVAAEDALFGVYCRRHGVPLMDGGTIRLPRILGHSYAMDMILTGRDVDGKEAFTIGLANRLVPKGQTLEYAKVLAATISSFPQTCLRSDRMSVIEQWSLSEAAAFSNEFKRGMDVIQSGETVAGAQKFVDTD